MFYKILIIVLTICYSNVSAGENTANDSAYIWHNCEDLRVDGKGWTDSRSFYDRLPGYAEKMVTKKVWDLSLQTAGLSIRFNTDADSIRVKWTLLSDELGLKNMPPTAVSGIDLYLKDENNKWIFAGNGRPHSLSNETRFSLSGHRAYLIYLPLYNGIKSMEIGIPRNRSFSQPQLNKKKKPVVFYGTSITQGGCASRPGMAATSIVGRELGVPIINLGFSGAGKMEPEMAELISELDASLYVLDCLWNMSDQMVKERVVPFVLKLRRTKPNTPVVLVEDSNYLNISPTGKGRLLREAYNNLISQGDKNLYFLSNKNMLGSDGEGTVDSVHPNDLGMLRQADVFTKFLTPLLLNRKVN